MLTRRVKHYDWLDLLLGGLMGLALGVILGGGATIYSLVAA